jgi:Gametolysin peptidase M11
LEFFSEKAMFRHVSINGQKQPLMFLMKTNLTSRPRSVTIHELGHNLGFRHSGFESEAYGDETGYMGFTIYQTGAPIKCFNAHKNWVSGWFDDREYTVNPSLLSPVLSRLVTFVDYNKDLEQNDVVLIRVGKYYIQYNRAKGINVDTGMHANQVSITYAEDALSDSEAVVGLSAGETAIIPNFRKTGYALVVEVCEFGSIGEDPTTASLTKQTIQRDPDDSAIDYAWVSIHLENGEQQSQCGKIRDPVEQQATLPPMTFEPTFSPPSSQPTLSPSLRPTQSPSIPPSIPPTLQPTPAPNSDNRKPTFDFAVDLSVPERPEKKEQVITIKDTTKLELTAEERNVRRRLKGRR